MNLIDWGTTSLRAVRVNSAGEVLAEHTSNQGIMHLERKSFESVFDSVLIALNSMNTVNPALNDSKNASPTLLSGMVGSRNGWAEAAYVPTPCSVVEIAANLLQIKADTFIVPGVSHMQGDTADVMRGEEVQIVGAAQALGLQDGCFVLPGTHSKWARLADARITEFATHMTGEAYALLRNESILAKLMVAAADEIWDAAAFTQGVQTAQSPGGVLHHLFGTRSLGLFGKLSAEHAPSYLSGLLIGEEFRSALANARPEQVTLVGSHQLVQAYATAAHSLGLKTVRAPANSTWLGLYEISKLIAKK